MYYYKYSCPVSIYECLPLDHCLRDHMVYTIHIKAVLPQWCNQNAICLTHADLWEFPKQLKEHTFDTCFVCRHTQTRALHTPIPVLIDVFPKLRY